MLSLPHLLVNSLCGQVLEGSDRNECDQSVQLLLGILIFVSLSGESDADSEGNISDSLRPHKLVELCINTDVLGAHLLLSELHDLLHGSGGSLLELPDDMSRKNKSKTQQNHASERTTRYKHCSSANHTTWNMYNIKWIHAMDSLVQVDGVFPCEGGFFLCGRH